MATTAKIQGVFTPHMVPLDDEGQIHEEELRRYVDWLIDHGVHGLYPNGSTGEFMRFTAPERRRIIEIVCSQTAGRVPVLAGAAEANVRETLAACEAYAQFGATAVAIVSPFYYRLSPESVYAYFREIALASPIDVTLYNIPMFASPIDVPTIRRLAEFPRIVGIKDSSGDVAFMMRLISAVRPLRPDFSFLTGWEAVLVPMLLVGCDGGTHATSGVVPELTRKLYDLTRAGQIRRGPAAGSTGSWSCSTPCSTRPTSPRASAPRWSCAASAWAEAASRMTAEQQVDRGALQRVLQCILADFGYVAPPLEGCAPRSGQPTSDRVSQIVTSVVHELRKRGAM